ncbi:hypothetical protein PpBr36_00676 [Pyricularia pennisetigena]|uniref:hypothetical protein n=1 Tax=Pyricularia pennisetigena TaxID=1578925 RepID=UPI00114DAF05|nr:hypothetical protein PpBr36_00676 [Pyricularia pennisetigena]TLS28569.1 hypothetical protein PpBr36_00676 [Pyricularia pennisetigena]
MEESPAEPFPALSGSEAYESAIIAAAAATPLNSLPPSPNDPQPSSSAASVLTSGPSPEGPGVEDHAAAERDKHVPPINRSKLADLIRAAKQLPDRRSFLGKRLPDRPLEESGKLPHRPASEDYWKRGDELLPCLANENGQSLAKRSSAMRDRGGSIKDPNYGRLSPPGDIEMRDWRDKRQVPGSNELQSNTIGGFHPDRLAMVAEGLGQELEPSPPPLISKSAKGANMEPLRRVRGPRGHGKSSQTHVHDAPMAKKVCVKREISLSALQVDKPRVATNSVSLPTTRLSIECQKRGFNPYFHAAKHENDTWSCSVSVLNKTVTTESIYANKWIAKHEAALMGLNLVRCLPHGKVSSGKEPRYHLRSAGMDPLASRGASPAPQQEQLLNRPSTAEPRHNLRFAADAPAQNPCYNSSSFQQPIVPTRMSEPIAGGSLGPIDFQPFSLPASNPVALLQLQHREQRVRQIEMCVGASIPWAFREDDLAVQAFVTGLHLGEGKIHTAQVQTMVAMSGSNTYRERSPLRGIGVPNARGRADTSRSRESPRARSQSPKWETKADSSGSASNFRGDYYPAVEVDRYRQNY